MPTFVNTPISSNTSQSKPSQIKVLIVEDGEKDRSIYCHYIYSDPTHSYQIFETDQIQEAFNIWRSHSPDVVLLDFDLADGNALKFLESIKASVLEPQPVIILTNYQDGLSTANAIKMGAADYLVKDEISAVSLRRSIHWLVDQFSLVRKLQRSRQQEALISEIALHVRQFLELNKIYEAIVQDVKKFLNADRTVIYKFNPNMSGTIVAEAVDAPWEASIHANIVDTCFRDNLGGEYRHGRIFAAEDIHHANLTACHIQLLERFQVKANLVVPILLPDPAAYFDNDHISEPPSLWGLLVVHQCSSTRHWDDLDLRLLQQLSVQLAIAIQQAELYQNLQNLNSSLEEKIHQRTAALQDSERKLRQSEQLLRISFNNAPVGMATLSLEGNFLTVNQNICKTYGYSAEELLHLKAIDITHPESIEPTIASLNRLVRGEASSTMLEKQYIHKNGKIVDAISRVSLIRDPDNDPVQFVVSVEDVTEKKQNEAKLAAAKVAEASNKAKSEFLAAMSHEIRTPMNAVIGMAGLLTNTPLSPQQQKFVSGIRQGGEVLLSVINKILDFSQIESGTIELEEHPFDFRNCIEEILELMSSNAAEKSLELSALINVDVPQRIIGDSTCLRQILVNLIGNAIKFTQKGEIAIAVNSTLVEPASNTYQLDFQVCDTGVGIAPEAINRLFKPFSQADSSITRQYGGTGLGLAICKELCKLMGGDIQVESTLGKGTTFSFTIRTQAIASESIAIAPELAQKRILVVNANKTVQKAILLYVQAWGMMVQSAYSEGSALKYLETNEFDVVLVERHLQSLDGFDFASNIQEVFPDLPIIIMTSVVDTSISSSTHLAGYLTKPITSSKLYQLFLNLFATADAQPPNHLFDSFQLSSNFANEYPFKILIVEDNSVNQQILSLMLESLGYRGDTVGNGLEAVNALERQNYDLVFMDIQMPIMDGLTACQHIRQLAERNPWIIGLSANAFRESREKALSMGMNDYLTKPLQIEDLVKTLQRISEYLKSSDQPLGLAKSDLLSRSLDSLTENPIELAKVPFNNLEPSITGSNTYSELEFSIAELNVINPATIQGLESFISKHELSEVIESYLAESELAIAKMKYSLKQLNFAGISFENHSLRGGCGTLGADRLVAICKELSHACKIQDQDSKIKGIEQVIQKLEFEFAKVAQVLKQKMSA